MAEGVRPTSCGEFIGWRDRKEALRTARQPVQDFQGSLRDLTDAA